MLASGSGESVWGRRVGAVVLALVCVLVTSSSASAFRTAADRGGFDGTTRVRWASPRISIVLELDAPPPLTGAAVREDLLAAMLAWNAVDCSELEIGLIASSTRAAAPGDGANTISWVRSDWAERGFPAGAAATTDVAYQMAEGGEWQIVEADVYLNADDFDWATGETTAGGARNVRAVLTHELGHVAGLGHSCESGGADGAPDCDADPAFVGTTMYPIYTGASQWSVQADDRDGVCFLYARAPDGGCVETCGVGLLCHDGRCVDACTWTTCTASERCSSGICVPATTPCSAGVECDPTSVCVDGACAVTFASWGDPCASDSECAAMLCERGACVPACTGDGFCPTGSTCTATGPERSMCDSALAPTGAPCRMPRECVGAVCLAGVGATPICTRPCMSGCSPGYACRNVEERAVCVPEHALVSSGCAVSASPPEPGYAGAFALVLALAGTMVSRRRPRQ